MRNKDETKGTAKQGIGHAKNKLGEWTGDRELEAEGEAQRAEGDLQKDFGEGRRKVGEKIRDAGEKIAR